MKNIDVNKVNTAAEKLLAAAEKIIDVGQNLNALTSVILETADNAEAENRGLDHASHFLAWAGSAGDLASDVLGAAEDIICTIHDLIGPSRGTR